ncbi:MAG TPA: oxidoreductase [Marmoricola sp.]|nr:oxidoreductase [Marmoricola sp.]
MTSPDPFEWLAQLEGIPSAYAGTRDGIDAILVDRGRRRTTPEQTAESLLIGAHASAVLEGSESTLEEMRAGEADEIAQAALRVSTEVLALVPVVKTSPLQAFARLHSVAAKGVLEDSRLGRAITAEASARIQELSAALTRTSVPGLLQAAIAHGELITAVPFASHNGIVARAVERLLMVATGVDPASVIAPELGHKLLRPGYESHLRGLHEGGQAGLHAWLLYVSDAQAKATDVSPVR